LRTRNRRAGDAIALVDRGSYDRVLAYSGTRRQVAYTHAYL